MGWRMVGPCWTQVGVSGVDSGPVLDPCWRLLGQLGVHVGVTWGPGRRLMGREGVCIDVLWANVELIVGVAGLNLAGWAVAWRQVGRIWPKVGYMLVVCWHIGQILAHVG